MPPYDSAPVNAATGVGCSALLDRWLFSLRLNGLVHFRKATLRICIQTSGENRDKKPAKLFTMNKAYSPLIYRLNHKTVFPIK